VNSLEFDIYNFNSLTAFDYKATVSFTSVLLCVQPPEGLISWWPLDETDGDKAGDIVDGNDGTYVNGPIPVEGKVAGALSFDGIGDYVDLGSDSSLNIPGSVTIDAWVKIIGDVVRWYNYFFADFDNTGWVSQLSLGVYSVGGNFQFYSYEGRSSGDNTYVLSSADKTAGEWYHVAVVRDDDIKTIKLYVNGNLEGSNSYAGKIPVSLQGNKYLGSSGSWGDYFNGELDEVEIYNRALSDLEIQSIFNAGSAGKCKLPAVIMVTIDIKPGSDPNSINLGSKGVVPVAVLTTEDFDASTVDPGTVLFADAYPVKWAMEDVDYDGDMDMLLHFKTQDLNLNQDSAEATLTGETMGGTPIEGTDTVNIVPK